MIFDPEKLLSLDTGTKVTVSRSSQPGCQQIGWAMDKVNAAYHTILFNALCKHTNTKQHGTVKIHQQ